MKDVCYKVYDFGELEELILKTYGQEYDIHADEELSNEDVKTYDNMTHERLDEWDIKNIDALRAGKPKMWSLVVIIQDMVNNGVLQPGNYLLEN